MTSLRWLLLLALPGLAHADKGSNLTLLHNLDGIDVLRLVEDVGHRAVLISDHVGDPLVNAWSPAANHGYQVLFYGCDDRHQGCTSIQFRSWFETRSDISLEALNEWNRARPFGAAFLDSDRDPTIEHRVRVLGGVTPEHLRSERDCFIRALTQFKQTFSENL